MSSGYYTVAKNATVDLDSSLSITSKSFRLSRVPVIAEGIEPVYSLKNCGWMDNGNVDSVKKSLGRIKNKNDKARLSLLLGAYYAFYPGFRTKYIDSGIFFLSFSKSICDELNKPQWSSQCAILLGKCYYKRNDIAAGKKWFQWVADQKNVDPALQAKSFNYQGMYCPFLANTTGYRLECLSKALHLYQQLADTANQINTLMNTAYLSFANQKVNDALSAANASLYLQKAYHFANSQYTYDLLAYLMDLRADFSKQLTYALAAINCAELTRDSLALGNFYSKVALSYSILKNSSESKKWKEKALQEYARHGTSTELYPVLIDIAQTDPNDQSGAELIGLIKTAIKKNPPANAVDQQFAYLALGHGYELLKDYKATESYYAKAEALQKYNPMLKGGIDNINILYRLGRFYVKIKNYRKGKIYLSKIITEPYKTFANKETLMHTYFSLHIIDSVSGNYLSSLNNLNKYSSLQDSIFSENQNKEITTLNIKYETGQKVKDIQLLTAQSQLATQRAATTRRITYSAIVILLFVIFMIYNRYHFNKKSNNLLKLQKEEIDQQNHSLQLLNHKQTVLLTEKELLLREIHHRVKNNLQTTMSLLNMQSNYIDNDAALDAIRSSQHRMQAMSLIHQQLYQSDTVAYINMDIYIRELISYLKQSFNGAGNISFNLRIEELTLDAAEAVPIGLIVNEAVTNAIKYAFPDGRTGNVDVILTAMIDYTYILKVNDDGIGIPESSEQKATNTLGLNLMKGLCEQLEGEFTIDRRNGTSLIFNFKVKRSIHEEIVN
ncbi:sensor histidine kinase [Mucilaginibacter sp. KACC 22773]|uniref:sensor histidine kinase n=1 Tax=Mucilaginibacter sp. KACC 22773 TaxID=3025671 RepID=UPI0023656F65|nr:sensor histidine kinase [Mucilaginibacter sp. KACC 22773]WDF81425.1 sensor histidine kinase [Mucilaginibacter sp. KACC 22773]